MEWYHCTHFCRSTLYIIKKSKDFRMWSIFFFLFTWKTVHFNITSACNYSYFCSNCFVCLDRSCDTLLANPATSLVVPAIGIILFALWGFLPLMRDIRNRFDVCFCYMQPFFWFTWSYIGLAKNMATVHNGPCSMEATGRRAVLI